MRRCAILLMAMTWCLCHPSGGACEVYGVRDPQGGLVHQVTITVTDKEVVIKKVTPTEQFNSLAITLNTKNLNLLRNSGLLKIQWLDARNVAGKPLDFTGPQYDVNSRTYKDAMKKSAGLRITDKSTANLFSGKKLEDLFTIRIEGKPIEPEESVSEAGRSLRLAPGREITSITVDRSTLRFDVNNFEKGEIVEVENRTKTDLPVSLELPGTWLKARVARFPGDVEIPRENWGQFRLGSSSGLSIVLVPEREPDQLRQLDGKDLVIRVLGRVPETKRIPIEVSEDLKRPGGRAADSREPGREPRSGVSTAERSAPRQGSGPAEGPRPQPRPGGPQDTSSGNQGGSLRMWIAFGTTFLLLAGTVGYIFFFLMPKIQVMEDRLAKNEMFIHGSREAMREELVGFKEEILRQVHGGPDQK